MSKKRVPSFIIVRVTPRDKGYQPVPDLLNLSRLNEFSLIDVKEVSSDYSEDPHAIRFPLNDSQLSLLYLYKSDIVGSEFYICGKRIYPPTDSVSKFFSYVFPRIHKIYTEYLLDSL